MELGQPDRVRTARFQRPALHLENRLGLDGASDHLSAERDDLGDLALSTAVQRAVDDNVDAAGDSGDDKR